MINSNINCDISITIYCIIIVRITTFRASISFFTHKTNIPNRF